MDAKIEIIKRIASERGIEPAMVDRYWPALSGGKIYMNPKSANEILGYSTNAFSANIKNCDGEYELIAKSHPRAVDKSSRKHYLIPEACLIKLMGMTQGKKVKILKSIYMQLRQLLDEIDSKVHEADMKDVEEKDVEDYVRADKPWQTQETKDHLTELNRQALNWHPKKKDEIFYIVTDRLSARDGLYKIGGTEDRIVRSRLSTYNTGRAQDRLAYYAKLYDVYDYHDVEHRIHMFTAIWKDKQGGTKEMVHMHYDKLVPIVEQAVAESNAWYEKRNSEMHEITKYGIEHEHVVPPALDISGRLIRQEARSLFNVSEAEQLTVLKAYIDEYLTRERGEIYRYESDKNITRTKIKWVPFTKGLQQRFSGVSNPEWKALMLPLITDHFKVV